METEFFVPEQKPVLAKTLAVAPQPSAIPPVAPKAETVGAQISRLRDECHLSEEELAEKTNMGIRSVQRHIAGESMPQAKNIRAYERIFSKLLNRQVVIRKMA